MPFLLQLHNKKFDFFQKVDLVRKLVDTPGLGILILDVTNQIFNTMDDNKFEISNFYNEMCRIPFFSLIIITISVTKINNAKIDKKVCLTRFYRSMLQCPTCRKLYYSENLIKTIQ